MGDVSVRAVQAADAPSMQAIYAPIVERTAISFELSAPTVSEFADRIRATTREFPWLAAEADGRLVGFAYASRHQDRAAYRWSVNVSVYVAEGLRGAGVGSALYRVLFEELRALGYVSAYAGIALPNEASVRLHEKHGFVRIGEFPNVGFKFGIWHDVGWWYLELQAPANPPPEPTRWPS